MGRNTFFQFNYIPYPLWRRKLVLPLKWLAQPLLRSIYPVREDRKARLTLDDASRYLKRYRLVNEPEHLQPVSVETSLETTPPIANGPIRLAAQWDPMETILMAWPVLYPPLWDLHAQVVEAVTPVATVTILIPDPAWASAAHRYLSERGHAQMDRIRWVHLPTNDIWIRDYGPVVGIDAQGKRAAANMIYDPLPNYPQDLDDSMPKRWAAHTSTPLCPLDLHNEGGNIWSDGAGTLLMTNQVYRLNPDIRRDELLAKLHNAFVFEKLILLPRLRLEETGHVDLVVKLASADTLLISAPNALFTGDRLRSAAHQLRRETNAAGQRYSIIELPTPALYFNWFGFPIRRSYTNALTVNGRVLVPVYGIQTDETALRIYEETLPDYEIIAIDCTVAANGGGAVHCLTKEVPRI